MIEFKHKVIVLAYYVLGSLVNRLLFFLLPSCFERFIYNNLVFLHSSILLVSRYLRPAVLLSLVLELLYSKWLALSKTPTGTRYSYLPSLHNV